MTTDRELAKVVSDALPVGEPLTYGSLVQTINAVRPLIAAEALREAGQAAERISIVYDQDSDDGWRNWIRERAAALAASKPCRVCEKPVIWIECPTGAWWAHIDHPADNHDAAVRDGR